MDGDEIVFGSSISVSNVNAFNHLHLYDQVGGIHLQIFLYTNEKKKKKKPLQSTYVSVTKLLIIFHCEVMRFHSIETKLQYNTHINLHCNKKKKYRIYGEKHIVGIYRNCVLFLYVNHSVKM